MTNKAATPLAWPQILIERTSPTKNISQGDSEGQARSWLAMDSVLAECAVLVQACPDRAGQLTVALIHRVVLPSVTKKYKHGN